TGHISLLSWSIERLLTFKIDKICPRPAEFSLGFPKSDRLLEHPVFLIADALKRHKPEVLIGTPRDNKTTYPLRIPA
ncbi:MAG: hypothetical protein ACSLFH_13385, partial [Desulfuromonadales bacterium]